MDQLDIGILIIRLLIKKIYFNVIKLLKLVFYEPATCVNCDDSNILGISGSKDHSACVWKLNNEETIDYSLVGHSDFIVLKYNINLEFL